MNEANKLRILVNNIERASRIVNSKSDRVSCVTQVVCLCTIVQDLRTTVYMYFVSLYYVYNIRLLLFVFKVANAELMRKCYTIRTVIVNTVSVSSMDFIS